MNAACNLEYTPEYTPVQKEAQEMRCYTVEDLQIILGISRGAVYDLLKRNEFRWFKVGSRYRISKKSFDEWLDSKF